MPCIFYNLTPNKKKAAQTDSPIFHSNKTHHHFRPGSDCKMYSERMPKLSWMMALMSSDVLL